MKIALLADIHGNMPALEAVIKDIESQEIDEVLVGGDLVGRGPEGPAVIERILGLGWPVLRGNHEDFILQFSEDREPQDWPNSEIWSAVRWMKEQLSQLQLQWIKTLPFSLRSKHCPSLVFYHGTPWSNRRGLGRVHSDQMLEEALQEAHAEVLVSAHSHRPMVRKLYSGIVLNVGSVGMSFNGCRKAYYAVVHIRGKSPEVEIRGVKYDWRETCRRYESTGLLKYGGVSAQLMCIEIQKALPYLTPFLKWAKRSGQDPNVEAMRFFLKDYVPLAWIQRWKKGFLKQVQGY